ATAREPPRVEADAVVHGPREQRENRGEEESAGSFEPHTPRPGHQQWNDAEGEQNGISRPHEGENGDAEADEGEASTRGCERRSGYEQCAARERRSEDGLARKLVEHQGVARIGEKGYGHRDRRSWTEEACRRGPAEEGAGVEDGHERLGESPVEDVESCSCPQRRKRRSEEK